MAGENVVRIVVTADNATQAGFDESAAGAEGMAGKVDAAAAQYDAAMAEMADANARLVELQGDDAASADELAAARDRVTTATLASIDAQVRLGQAELEQSAAARGAGDATEETAGKTDAAGASALGFGSKMKLAALGMAVGAAVSIKMAADWQTSLTQLTTSAGEPVKAMGAIRQGILALSVGTDTSVTDLTSGLYMISSAGFTGAKGLSVLGAAAEGAKSEGASLSDVANVLTSAMNAYNLPASKATATTNELIATVASGKMHLQDLATSLSSVLPVAASAHISLAQVGGAIATMTMQGMSAHRATMDLANMIRSLVDPSATASHEMQAMGLNANTVANELGSRGLTGTLTTLTEAILRNSKGGMVMAGDMKAMTPAAQALSEKILSGGISFTKAKAAMQSLSPVQEKLVSNFQAQATSATGLKQTFDAAMSKMVGGATGLNVALLIGGKHMDAFQKNVKTISGAANSGGKNIDGWSRIQGNFNFKLGQAGKAAEAVGYSLGDALLPAATKVMGVIATFGEWLTRNKAAAIALATVIVGFLATVIGGKLVSSLNDAREAFSALADSEMLQSIASKAAAAGQWLLDAAMDANPIMLIIIAIGLLVAAFVLLWTHCAAFRDFWKDLWRDTEKVAVDAFHILEDAFRLYVKMWEVEWDVVKTIAVDAFHILVDAVKLYVKMWEVEWDLAKEIFMDVWHFIVDFIQDEVDGIKAVLSWFGRLGGLFRGWWDDAANAVMSATDRMMSFVRSIPGRILGALSSLGSMLFSLGSHIISMLASGITSAAGSVLSGAMHDVMSVVGDFIPHSPAKRGPLSGSGSPDRAGARIAQMLGQGMASGLPEVTAAAARMAAAAGIGPGGVRSPGGYAGYGTGGGLLRLEVVGGGASAFEQFMLLAIRNWVRVYGGGGPDSVQRAYGRV